MKHVRITIGHNLIEALHQCNLADVESPLHNVNDLNWKCHCQHEAYGHIANALTSMGFNRAREVYSSEGDIDAAHTEIEAQNRHTETEAQNRGVAA